jgi:hypothetical protein
MIERALKLKDAIHLYQDYHYTAYDRADYLTSDDWRELTELQALLKPIYYALMRVSEKDSTLYNVLTLIDFILIQLERAKEQSTHTDASYYKVYVNLSWSKLNQYYHKTNLNPAYIMAIFLHPHFKLAWFKKHWSGFEYNKAVAYVHNEYSHAKERFIERNPVAPKPLKAIV